MDNKYQKFIEWKTKKLGANDPKTLDEFCAKHKVSKEQIEEFVSKETFADDILMGTLNWAKSKTPEMLHLLYESARTTKSAGSIEKFLNLAHELNKKKEEKANYQQFNFFGNLDDERFKRIAAREVGLPTESREG